MDDIRPFLKIIKTSSFIVPCVTLLTVISATAASVTINWMPNHPTPEGYRVFARRSDQHFDFSMPDWEGVDTVCRIDGLEDQTEYFFVVQAFDADQHGDYSAEIHYVTPKFNGLRTGNENEGLLGDDFPAKQQSQDGLTVGMHAGGARPREPLLPPIPLSAQVAADKPNCLVLNLDDQAVFGGNPPAATHWQIFDTRSNNCVLELISDRQLSQLKVSTVSLKIGITYRWRARFFDNHGRVSDWSRNSILSSDARQDGSGERDEPMTLPRHLSLIRGQAAGFNPGHDMWRGRLRSA